MIRRAQHRNSMNTSIHTAPVVTAEGVLVVQKEPDWTSHDVVAKVRRLLGVKVGHAGTLDPAATGVLPLLIGRATRVAEYLVEWEKEYRAVLRLGVTTDTQDATGRVLTRRVSPDVDDAAIRAAVATFVGPQQQVPPMFSAVKIGGRPLYKAARAGETIARRERSIVIHKLDVLAIDGPDVTLGVVCSKGTYIRTLCADIGDVLGVGGHLRELERRRVGPLSIDQALTIDQIAARAAVGVLGQHLISIDHVLEQLPAVVVPHDLIPRVLHGGPVAPVGAGKMPFSSGSVSVRLKDESGRLLAIGKYTGTTSSIKIDKVLTESLSGDERQ